MPKHDYKDCPQNGLGGEVSCSDCRTEPCTDHLELHQYHEIISEVGKIVGTELHRLIQSNLTNGVEQGLARFKELYPLCAIDPVRVEALLRREICSRLVDLNMSAYDGWDEQLFNLSNEGSKNEDTESA